VAGPHEHPQLLRSCWAELAEELAGLNNQNPWEKQMDNSDSRIKRREFLQKSAVVAAGSAALGGTALSYARIAGTTGSRWGTILDHRPGE